MLILTLRGLWPVVGAAASVLVPFAIGWPIWVALLLLVPALWLAHLVMTWLAIAALRAGTSQHAREMVPDLESLGLPSDPRSPSGSSGSWKPSGEPSAAAVADLARVIEAFGPEDLGAMVFARAQAAPADYETMRASVLTGVVADLRSSGRFEDHVVESHAAVASVRQAVAHAIDRIPDLQPSPEFEAQILEHASDLARYIVLRPRLSASEYEALWAPYRVTVPELAMAAEANGASAASHRNLRP